MILLCAPIHLRVFFTATVLDGWRRIDKLLLAISVAGEFFLAVFSVVDADISNENDPLSLITDFPENYVANT